MYASKISLSEQTRRTNQQDLAIYLTQQASRLNRAVVGTIQGVEIVVTPNDNLDDVRAQLNQKCLLRYGRNSVTKEHM